MCLTTRSKHLAPCPAVTLVDGRFKLWSYVQSDFEIIDVAPAETNVFHTAYLSARSDGLTKLWWDGKLLYDGMAPLKIPMMGKWNGAVVPGRLMQLTPSTLIGWGLAQSQTCVDHYRRASEWRHF